MTNTMKKPQIFTVDVRENRGVAFFISAALYNVKTGYFKRWAAYSQIFDAIEEHNKEFHEKLQSMDKGDITRYDTCMDMTRAFGDQFNLYYNVTDTDLVIFNRDGQAEAKTFWNVAWNFRKAHKDYVIPDPIINLRGYPGMADPGMDLEQFMKENDGYYLLERYHKMCCEEDVATKAKEYGVLTVPDTEDPRSRAMMILQAYIAWWFDYMEACSGFRYKL